MTVVTRSEEVPDDLPEPAPLEQGDHLDRETFHARYEAMPEHVRAELVGGVVHMPSPAKRRHGKPTAQVVTWLGNYEAATPGVEALENATIILADDGEPQPDACLLILPECGGQTAVDEEDYVVGAPELVVEVANSTAAIDLFEKKQDYEKAGVREYVIVVVRAKRIEWLARGDNGFAEAAPDAEGIYRSGVFPGLWLNGPALIRRDLAGVLATLRQGMESPEHAAFVARLASAAGGV